MTDNDDDDDDDDDDYDDDYDGPISENLAQWCMLQFYPVPVGG